MEIDETCLSNSYKSMNDFFEEMELDSELLYQFYLTFRGQQISFPMKMYCIDVNKVDTKRADT